MLTRLNTVLIELVINGENTMSIQNQNNKKKALIAGAVILLLPSLAFIVRMSQQRKAAMEQTQSAETAQFGSQSSVATSEAESVSSKSTPVLGRSKEEKTKAGLIPGQATSNAKDSAKGGAEATAETTQAQAPVAGGTQAKMETPTEPPKGCVTITYQHRKTTGHNHEEACFQHKNLIRLKHDNVNSVCVRVNGTPVPFEFNKSKTNEILVAAVAGPKAQITARYCFGKTKCDENCTIPKDDFMDAIGGDKPMQVAQWDAHDTVDKDSDVNAHLDSEMKKELDRLDRVETTVFADWIGGSEAPACGTKHAQR